MTSSFSSSCEPFASSLNCFPAAQMSSRNGREESKDCVLVSECAACAAAPSQEKRHFQVTDKYFSITMEAESLACPWAHQTSAQLCLWAPGCGNHRATSVSWLTAWHCCQIMARGRSGSQGGEGKGGSQVVSISTAHSRNDIAPSVSRVGGGWSSL